MKKRWVVWCLGSVVLFAVVDVAKGGSALAASVSPPDRALEVTVDSGRLTVHAHQARLTDVLEAIGRQAHVTMVLQGALDGPVNVVFADLPLDEGVRRLTRWYSVVMIYDPADGTDDPALAEVWVTGSSRSVVATGAASGNDIRAGAPASGHATEATGLSIALSRLNEETRQRQIERLMRTQGEFAVVDALREAATTDPGSITRYRAIQALATMQNPVAVDAMRSIVRALHESATMNPDPRIRRGAIKALASIDSPEAVAALQTALSDRHPGVVSEARRALARQGRARAGHSVR